MDATFSTWIIEMCVINSSHKSIQISVNSFFVGITFNRVRTEDCRLTEKKKCERGKKIGSWKMSKQWNYTYKNKKQWCPLVQPFQEIEWDLWLVTTSCANCKTHRILPQLHTHTHNKPFPSIFVQCDFVWDAFACDIYVYNKRLSMNFCIVSTSFD